MFAWKIHILSLLIYNYDLCYKSLSRRYVSLLNLNFTRQILLLLNFNCLWNNFTFQINFHFFFSHSTFPLLILSSFLLLISLHFNFLLLSNCSFYVHAGLPIQHIIHSTMKSKFLCTCTLLSVLHKGIQTLII